MMRTMLVVFATLALTAPTSAQVTSTQLAERMWRLDGAIDVIVVLDGPDGLLMVDTGYPFAAEGVRAELRRLTGKEAPDLILNTHWHHTFANHVYVDEGVEVIAHEAVPRRMASVRLMGGRTVPASPETGRPTRTFTDSLTLDFNGERIRLIHLPGAHTDSDAVVVFERAGVVMAGDLYVPHVTWTDIEGGGDAASLVPAVDRLLELTAADAIVVPGHGRTSTRSDVLAFRDMVTSTRARVATERSSGTTLAGLKHADWSGLDAWGSAGVPEWLFIETLYRGLNPVRTSSAPATAFENGSWLRGGRYEQRTMYAVDGVLTSEPPARIERRLDLAGGFVVPPFGEAHTHHLAARLEEEASGFLDAGIFYAMVQDPSDRVTDAWRDIAGRDDTPDVLYTQGVVTPSDGVIPRMYAMFAERGRYGAGVTVADLDGDVLFMLDSIEDVDAAWPGLRARNDRFIKVIVAFEEEAERRRADPETYRASPPTFSALPGVSAEVLRRLVALAHADGLEVSAHVETAADFRLAGEAGVDYIAHMPASWQIGEGTGYGADELEPWLLTAEDVRPARAAGTVVITTLSPSDPSDPRLPLFREVHRRNLETLARGGAKIVIGSDQFAGTVIDEALFIRDLGVLSDAEVFTLLAVQTPRFLFPDREIGLLRDGWEANFLVLDGDPLERLDHVRDVRLRVKQGWVLDDRVAGSGSRR